MKIGVAIPTHHPDLQYLNRCLKSIESQTYKPSLVSISASSSDELQLKEYLKEYSFPLIYVTSKEKQNAAKNRNIAANLLLDKEQVDVISFFDSDDEMYPNRLEYIVKGIENSDFIVHNFVHLKSNSDHKDRTHDDYICFENEMIPNPGWHGCLTKSTKGLDFAHGHVSVTSNVWKNEKFREEKEFLYKEDSEYCKRLCLKNYKGSYLKTQLSKYHNY